MTHSGMPSRASGAFLALLSALGIALIGGIALLSRARHRPHPLLHHHSLERFRRAILNNTKQNVAAALGPPNAAIMIQTGPHGAPSSAQNWWQADTWYYPLSRRHRSALAIRFDNQQAREVQIIHTPR